MELDGAIFEDSSFSLRLGEATASCCSQRASRVAANGQVVKLAEIYVRHGARHGVELMMPKSWDSIESGVYPDIEQNPKIGK